VKVLIDIPEAFEVDYNSDRFADFFQRCLADMGTCCGNFELEIAVMMIRAFAESRPYDPDKIVEQLWDASFERFGCDGGMGGELVVNMDDAIEIVKAGGADAEH